MKIKIDPPPTRQILPPPFFKPFTEELKNKYNDRSFTITLCPDDPFYFKPEGDPYYFGTKGDDDGYWGWKGPDSDKAPPIDDINNLALEFSFKNIFREKYELLEKYASKFYRTPCVYKSDQFYDNLESYPIRQETKVRYASIKNEYYDDLFRIFKRYLTDLTEEDFINITIIMPDENCSSYSVQEFATNRVEWSPELDPSTILEERTMIVCDRGEIIGYNATIKIMCPDFERNRDMIFDMFRKLFEN